MAIGIYDKGDTVRLSASFTVSGTYFDPTGVTLKIRNPDASIDTYTYGAAEISKLSTGRYYKDIVMSNPGQVYYRFEGSGTLVATDESYIIIDPSELD